MSKKFLYLLIAVLLVLAYVFYCFTLKGTVIVKERIELKAPPVFLYQNTIDINDWPKWLSWKSKDGQFKFKPGSFHINVNANFNYEFKPYGEGYVQITNTHKDSIVVSKLVGSRLPAEIFYEMRFIPINNKVTEFQWRAFTKKKIPTLLRPFYGDVESKVRNQVVDDLAYFAAYTERALGNKFGIKTSRFPGMKFFGKEGVVHNTEIPSFYSNHLPAVYRYLDSTQQKITGNTCGMIFDWEGEYNYVYLLAGFPTEKKVKPPKYFNSVEIDPGPCLMMDHYGHYNNLGNAHATFDYFLRNSDFVIRPPIIEEYVTNPALEPDSTKWLTRIYYLIKTDEGYSKGIENVISKEEAIKRELERQKGEIRKF